MAEAVIGVAVEVTLSKVFSTVEEQINLQWGLKDELNKIRDSLAMTRDFLQYAETRQVDKEPVKAWWEQLRKFAEKAAGVLDELAYEDLRRKVETQIRKKVRNFFSISKNPIVFRFKMAQTVKGLNISLKEINDRANGFGLQRRVQALPPLSRGSQDTDSFVDSSQVVGREGDVSKIIDLLINPSTQQTLSIISIVGMGGLGKTTLAKSVYKNERTKNYFNKMIWVCVSEKFDVEKILGEMLVSVTGQTREGKSRNSILEEIKKKLDGKTYLLVLDDVWDQGFSTWEDFRGSLLGINENKRCSILVTTRNENVAVVRETPLENRFSPRILVEDECWAIIKNRAFQDSSISQQLEEIGREIARKCRGVPLVAVVIGGTMCNKWDVDEWVSLRDSSDWGSSENSEWIMNVLKLSFDRLPSPSLKQCFVYCSIFPKDFRMEKEQLIQLWMAEGFLQQTRGKGFEDIGDEYFNYLLSISLLQDVERDWLGCITSCKMHDFVHDLALSIRNSEISGNCKIQQQTAYDGAKLWNSLFVKSSFPSNVTDFKGLRVLKFCDADISSLPESIGRLKRLRYLDISNTYIDRLPKSITQLYLLQTLRLLRCRSLKKLPEGMKKLVSLKHLYISYTRHVPSEIESLTDLQTLPIFDVGRERGRGIGELRCLNELGGKLEISNLQDVRNKEEARRAKIWAKKKLHSLKLEWIYRREGEVSKDDEQVLEGLEPHSNLKSLTIHRYMGDCCPSWLVFRKNGSPSVSNFEPMNLLMLELIDCRKLKNLPTDLALFTKLKFLKIVGSDNVKCIGKEFYINNNSDGDKNKCNTLFPCLEKFTLKRMREVKEWVVDVEPAIRVFPCLKELRIEGCDNLSSVPVMSRFSSLETLTIGECGVVTWIGDADAEFPSSLKVLKIWRCGKLRSIPSVEVEGEGGMSSLEMLNVEACDELREIEEGLLASSTCLREVFIKDCPNLISIPSIQGCSSLKSLTLSRCKGLTSLPSGLRTSTSLETLNIKSCDELTWIGDADFDGVFPSSLKVLEIRWCRKLRSIPSVEAESGMSSLENFLVDGCDELREIEEGLLASSTCLRDVFIKDCTNLISIPSIQGCSSLLSLWLDGCKGLTSLPSGLRTSASLQDLEIVNCNSLKSIPEDILSFGCLTNLKTLDLGPFSEELEEFPGLTSIHHLHYSSLQSLTLYGWEKLVSLPHQLQHLIALEYLSIEKFSGLKTLPEWLGNLSSLRSLYIEHCENLEHLPSAEAMQRLSNLQKLYIYGCPQLKGNSEERSKISHIPQIRGDLERGD